ncbi:MAG: hypothetical protein AAB417_03325 [Patescibacteria group bacterium]
MDIETTQIESSRKPLPIIVGIVVIALVVGVFFLLMRGADKEKTQDRNPDVSGLLDRWQVDKSKAYAIIMPGDKKSIKQAMTLDASTKYVYRRGKKRDAERPEETGALANISEGLYIGVYFKQGTQIADTIIYADWPL